jgi:hypothetical protein
VRFNYDGAHAVEPSRRIRKQFNLRSLNIDFEQIDVINAALVHEAIHSYALQTRHARNRAKTPRSYAGIDESHWSILIPKSTFHNEAVGVVSHILS